MAAPISQEVLSRANLNAGGIVVFRTSSRRDARDSNNSPLTAIIASRLVNKPKIWSGVKMSASCNDCLFDLHAFHVLLDIRGN